ncbi:protein prenylyltransferase [Saccharata proteae CBS 121410]|uniref:Protein prenylyltransferase n=1 Tax=Saccharata proteae CBS 121410 TaxID=1314787 RepID=A0A9P4HSX8_9PEZI|nr:protein prenylyltransferase [Saccharata proteae CBS 121410]
METSLPAREGHDNAAGQAYTVLNNYFRSREYQVVEIEVLPTAFIPPEGSLILEDGDCIGIPKKVLASAFLTARSLFFRSLNQQRQPASECLEYSRIMLLFDPEHLTAANFRKRYLMHLVEENGTSDCEDVGRFITFEYWFLDSVLTSPLHRQSKSPTLWYHRRWLLQAFYPLVLTCVDTCSQFTPLQDFLEKEISAVLKSGERHPKNYYAWQYARRLVEQLEKEDLAGGAEEFAAHIRDCTQRVSDWCLRNPSDTSGWNFLLFLLEKPAQNEAEVESLLSRILGILDSFKWEHESIWAFLRVALSGKVTIPHATRQEYIHGLEKQWGMQNGELCTRARPEQPPIPTTAQKSLAWIHANGEA